MTHFVITCNTHTVALYGKIDQTYRQKYQPRSEFFTFDILPKYEVISAKEQRTVCSNEIICAPIGPIMFK